MSDIEYPYEHTDRAGDVVRVFEADPGETAIIQVNKKHGSLGSAYVPTNPAELHRLVEAILGRKVVAIIYEGDAPDMAIWEAEALTPQDHWHKDPIAYHRRQAALHATAANTIEARDAAAKEQERAEEGERRRGIADVRRVIAYSEPGPFDRWAESLYDLGLRAVETEERP